MNRQVARNFERLGINGLELRAFERDRRKLLDAQKIRTAQMLVALRVATVDASGLDCDVDRVVVGIGIIYRQCARDIAESPPRMANAHVAGPIENVRMDRVDRERFRVDTGGRSNGGRQTK